jgi:hypothetical protein
MNQLQSKGSSLLVAKLGTAARLVLLWWYLWLRGTIRSYQYELLTRLKMLTKTRELKNKK